MTIGYGTWDIFFDDCVGPWFVIYVQLFVAVLLDTITFGIYLTVFTNPSRRSASVMMSDMAVLREIDGALYFMFQVCQSEDVFFLLVGVSSTNVCLLQMVELRRYSLIEAHVSLFCMRDMVDNEGTGDYIIFMTDGSSRCNMEPERGLEIL